MQEQELHNDKEQAENSGQARDKKILQILQETYKP